MEKQRDRRQGEGGQAAKRLGSFYRGFVNINRGFFFFFFFLLLGEYDVKSGFSSVGCYWWCCVVMPGQKCLTRSSSGKADIIIFL